MRLAEIEKQDKNHQAILWALKQPGLKQLCQDIFVTRDTLNDAKRFESSKEFKEYLKILGKPNSRSLLDVGCGNGIASWSFAKNGFTVTATDICVSRIVGLGAAKKLQNMDDYYFEIVRGDAHGLPFKNSSYDIVFVRQALHHADDLNGFIKELCRVLKPGGIFIASREQVIRNKEQLKELLDGHPLHHITQDEKAFKRSQYLAAMGSSGVKKVKVLKYYESVINYLPLTVADLTQMVLDSKGAKHACIYKYIPWTRKVYGRRLSDIREESHFTLDTYIGKKESSYE